MHLFRSFKNFTPPIRFRKGHLILLSPTFHLILYTILISFLVYAWKNSGCPVFSESYICQSMSIRYFVSGGDDMVTENEDFTRLIDIKNFSFLTNGVRCNESNLTLLVLIHSDTNNFYKRATIRKTWGSVVDTRYKLLFLLGTPKHSSVQLRLNQESTLHGDLIQGDFVDAYRNLTYKHVMGLKWMKYFCPHVKYLLKTDDDVFVNLPIFLNYLEKRMELLNDSKLILCLPERNARACRSNRSKWKVKMSEYKFRTYPTFCQGYTILYSADVVTTLYFLAQRAKYFWIDDVFVTGILRLATNFFPRSFHKFVLPRKNLKKVANGDLDINNYLLGPSNIGENDIKNLWSKTKVR